MADTDEIGAWLLGEGRRLSSPADLLAGLCRALGEAGIPVHRSTLGAPLLHPVAQSTFASWSTEEGGSDNWFVWTPENLRLMRSSPIHDVYEHGRGARLDLTREADRERYGIAADLAGQGYSEYDTFPLAFSDGSFKVFTAATRSPGGFDDAQYLRLQSMLPALATVFEGIVAARTAQTLLDTYVGRRAGRRVLSGEIHRGDGSRIPAVILFSDIRGFTALSARLGEAELLERLNAYFGLVTGCVDRNGGEVLKFIGDAVLAIFPVEEDEAQSVARAEAAIGDILSGAAAGDWPGDVAFGIGLHAGEIFYGNVGGAERLDFTVIGPAVNVASRIEGLCHALDEPVLVSQRIRDLSDRPYRDRGAHELKGVEHPVRVFAPAA